MRKLIARILVFLLSKIDPSTFRSCVVDKKFTVEFQRYVPNDNKWHHVAYTIDCYIKRNKKDKVSDKYISNLYLDGLKVYSKKKNGK